MKSFFKIFLASLLASILVLLVLILLGVKFVSSVAEPELPEVKPNTVLFFDLSIPVLEQTKESGFDIPEGKTPQISGLYDLVRAIKYAETDPNVKGIYLQCNGAPAGYATHSELRAALLAFKAKKKFIYAYAERLDQRAYELAQVANKIYVMPMGAISWLGYGIDLTFFKGTLDKLEVEPQIIYAGKFKSFTEPFRLAKMSNENRTQLTGVLEDLYGNFLSNTATASGIDTVRLRQMANTWAIKQPADAANAGLITATKYTDEVADEMRSALGLKPNGKLNLMPIADYVKVSARTAPSVGKKIALIFAQGDIVDGQGDDGEIGGETYAKLVRKARLDSSIKAVVLRVNSPGGSVFGSEAIWREVWLCKHQKPVVVSMGDVAASGGYYISCPADSIFVQANTLTGSIGVFVLYFNAQKLFNNKLGISFDAVKTGPYADFGSLTRAMTAQERQNAQTDVDSVYEGFVRRVASGRRLPAAVVDSIAQGRVWSGKAAVQLGLADKIGGIQDAIDCAARMAKADEYQLREWPIVKSFWDKLAEAPSTTPALKNYALEQKLGKQNWLFYNELKRFHAMAGVPQMRLPFSINP
jgi:protease IV